jgi:hypothetical protein
LENEDHIVVRRSLSAAPNADVLARAPIPLEVSTFGRLHSENEFPSVRVRVDAISHLTP